MGEKMDWLAARVATVWAWFEWRPQAGVATMWARRIGVALLVLLLLFSLLGWYWSREPDIMWVNEKTPDQRVVVGYATADTLVRVASELLDKPGGYLTNDVTPPSIFLDNIPNWEQGVLLQVKDVATIMRNHASRSQSQSAEDPDLAGAEPEFYFNPNRWILPTAESKFRDGVRFVESYRGRLIDGNEQDAQFYARADNLREYLSVVEMRLGSLSQSLSASVGEVRVGTDLANDPDARSTKPLQGNVREKTPWLEIDDRFYQARGYVWALVAILRAVEFDFNNVLEKKNARVSLRQVIRELEASLGPLGSPIILNGRGYGMFANHSLVMASYLSRANAGVINLRELLDQG